MALLSVISSANDFQSDNYCYLQRPIVEVTGHKAHGPVPEPGSIVIARVRGYFVYNFVKLVISGRMCVLFVAIIWLIRAETDS